MITSVLMFFLQVCRIISRHLPQGGITLYFRFFSLNQTAAILLISFSPWSYQGGSDVTRAGQFDRSRPDDDVLGLLDEPFIFGVQPHGVAVLSDGPKG